MRMRSAEHRHEPPPTLSCITHRKGGVEHIFVGRRAPHDVYGSMRQSVPVTKNGKWNPEIPWLDADMKRLILDQIGNRLDPTTYTSLLAHCGGMDSFRAAVHRFANVTEKFRTSLRQSFATPNV